MNLSEEEIQGLKEHTNIIIEEGLDSEDDIQSLLQKWVDLYNKEKEKNTECIKTGDLERAVGFLMNNNDLSNYISKDKIREKIEEVKDGTFDAKIVLQSLLEKE